MKKILVISFLSVMVFTLMVYPAQEETIKEEVLVVNVEVPVRVFFKGKAVGHLTRDDFLVYEGKKLQKINGFFIKKRKIRGQHALPKTKTDPESYLPSRYFVLNFSISDYNKELQEGLGYFFDNLLRDDDQLLVLANEKTLSFNSLPDKDKVYPVIDRMLSEQAKLLRSRLVNDMRRLKNETTMFYQYFSNHRGVIQAAFDLMKAQWLAWQHNYRQYILPDLLKYIHLAKYLQRIKKQKWVINFYQPGLFPRLREDGRMNRQIQAFLDKYTTGGIPHERVVLNNMYNRLDKDIDEAAVSMVKDISKLFYGVDAAFHTILIPTRMRSSYFENYQFKATTNSIENSLRKITRDSGGALITSNNLVESLKTIQEKETVYYMLTYAPLDPGKIENIRIITKNKDYKVVYDDNIRAYYMADYLEKHVKQITAVKLSDLTLQDKVLHLVIKDFLVPAEPRDAAGKINLHLVIKDRDNNILYNKNKSMVPIKNTVTVSIPVNWLEKGEYFVFGDVKDLLTGAVDTKFIQPLIR